MYRNRIQNTERSIQESRAQIGASQGKAERYGFASMAAVRDTPRLRNHALIYGIGAIRPYGGLYVKKQVS